MNIIIWFPRRNIGRDILLRGSPRRELFFPSEKLIFKEQEKWLENASSAFYREKFNRVMVLY